MWQRGVLARMVIKNDKVLLVLWKLRFLDGLSPKECVDRLTDAKVSCKTQIYETIREFDGASMFFPCLDQVRARTQLMVVLKRLRIKVLVKPSIENGIRGLRVWRK